MTSSKQTELLVLHHLPLEYYPPVINLLEYFSSKTNFRIRVIAAPTPPGMNPVEIPGVQIFRCFRFSGWPLSSLWEQAAYTLLSLATIRFRKVGAILQFEPHSALPTIVAKSVFGFKIPLFIHHHEYYAPGDLGGKGGRLPAKLLKWESRYLLPAARWISQTNGDRLNRFAADHRLQEASSLRTLPNYPPRAWSVARNRAWLNDPSPQRLRLVHVGSVSLGDTWIAEITRWVAARPNSMSLDLFAQHPPRDLIDYFADLSAPNIRFIACGVPYSDLPEILPDYHVGLVLYKGNTLNFVYNQPNKVFEYLACGLDVWYPGEMLGMKTMERRDAFPQIVQIDFQNLENINPSELTDRADLQENLQRHFADEVLDNLEDALSEAM